MSDAELRRLQRRWAVNPWDEHAARRFFAANRRSAFVAPRPLLERVRRATSFDARYTFAVWAVLPNGNGLRVGMTAAGGERSRVYIPKHRLWWVRPWYSTDVVVAQIPSTLREEQVPGLALEPRGGVESCWVSDDGLARLSDLPRLRWLRLRRCPAVTPAGLIRLAEQLPGLRGLELIDLEPGVLARALPALVERLPRLTWLSVSGAGDRELALLRGLPVLNTLKLDRCAVDSGLADLGDLPHLETLRIWRSPLKNLQLEHVATLQHVRRLDLLCHGGPFLERFGAGGWPQIRLGRHASFTARGLHRLGAMTRLQQLMLTWESLRDCDLAKLPFLERLIELRLPACGRVTDAGLGHLAWAKRLRVLDLQGCQVEGQGLARLAHLRRLEELALTSSSPAVVKALLAFPNLKRLQLNELDDPEAWSLSSGRSLSVTRPRARLVADVMRRLRPELLIHEPRGEVPFGWLTPGADRAAPASAPAWPVRPARPA